MRPLMQIIEVLIHGNKRYKVETFIGRRKRQHFKTRGEAEAAVKAAAKHKDELGKAWELLSATEKVELMSTLKEIKKAGWTLAEVWKDAQQSENRPRKCTLSKAVADLIEAKRGVRRSKSHLQNLKWYLEKFIAGRESMDVSSIGEPQLVEWFAARREAPRSERQHRGLLSALFDYCWRKRYISENPVLRLEKIHIEQEVPAILTTRQATKAVLWVRRNKPRFLAWFALALFVGMRPESEAELISWKDIDLENKRIIVTKTKTRRPRIIDLSFCPPALAWLRAAKKLKAKLPLAGIMRSIYLRRVRDRLGFKVWPQDILRHTAASNLLAYHQDAGKVAAFLGHSAEVLLKHYKALVFKEDAARFMAILPKPRHFKH